MADRRIWSTENGDQPARDPVVNGADQTKSLFSRISRGLAK
jgi:hypothetical protein